MAEECQYYHNDGGWWGYGYTCLLKQAEGKDRKVDDDWVHKFCWGYHYSECPFYQAKHGAPSGCYLTSACTEARGLPDDCTELTTLRAFRDNYVRNQPNGENDIKHYYDAAPKIVQSIHALDCSEALPILDEIYTNLVQPCLLLIEHEHSEAAYLLYKQYALQLEARFLPSQQE